PRRPRHHQPHGAGGPLLRPAQDPAGRGGEVPGHAAEGQYLRPASRLHLRRIPGLPGGRPQLRAEGAQQCPPFRDRGCGGGNRAGARRRSLRPRRRRVARPERDRRRPPRRACRRRTRDLRPHRRTSRRAPQPEPCRMSKGKTGLGEIWSLARSRTRGENGAHAKGALRQMIEMAGLLALRGIGPGFYQLAGFWRRDVPWRHMVRYMNPKEYAAAVDRLNKPAYHKLSQNKVVEKAIMRLYGIATTELLGILNPVT